MYLFSVVIYPRTMCACERIEAAWVLICFKFVSSY